MPVHKVYRKNILIDYIATQSTYNGLGKQKEQSKESYQIFESRFFPHSFLLFHFIFFKTLLLFFSSRGQILSFLLILSTEGQNV